jgi:hypothetical protein
MNPVSQPISRPTLNPLFKTFYGYVGNQCVCSPQPLPLTKSGTNGTNGTNETNGSNGSTTTNTSLCASSNSLNTSTNQTSITRRMRYSQQVQIYGMTQSSTSYAKKTCRIGGPTFSY